jgi:hypothetical protein
MGSRLQCRVAAVDAFLALREGQSVAMAGNHENTIVAYKKTRHRDGSISGCVTIERARAACISVPCVILALRRCFVTDVLINFYFCWRIDSFVGVWKKHRKKHRKKHQKKRQKIKKKHVLMFLIGTIYISQLIGKNLIAM